MSAVYLQQFPSYSNHNCKKSSFLRTLAFIFWPLFFVCPGDAPVAITQNVARMKRQFSACQTPRIMYPSIFNSFPFIRTASAKNRRFHVPHFNFLFVPCGRLSWLPVSFLLHVKHTLSYRIVSYRILKDRRNLLLTRTN